MFDLFDGHETGDYRARQDDSASKLEARLTVHPELMRRRDLMIPIHTISFAPAINHPDSRGAGLIPHVPEALIRPAQAPREIGVCL